MPSEVVAGLYVEKTDGHDQYGPLSEQWDWVWFVREVRREDVQSELTSVMAKHDLRIGDYRGQGFAEPTAVGGVGRIVDGSWWWMASPVGGWDAYADHLDRCPWTSGTTCIFGRHGPRIGRSKQARRSR